MRNKFLAVLAALASSVFLFPANFADISALTKQDTTGRFVVTMPVANSQRSGAGETFIGPRSPAYLVQSKTRNMARLWDCKRRVLNRSIYGERFACLDPMPRLSTGR